MVGGRFEFKRMTTRCRPKFNIVCPTSKQEPLKTVGLAPAIVVPNPDAGSPDRPEGSCIRKYDFNQTKQSNDTTLTHHPFNTSNLKVKSNGSGLHLYCSNGLGPTVADPNPFPR